MSVDPQPVERAKKLAMPVANDMLDLAVDPETGERLAAALQDQIERTQSWIERARGMAEPIPFGKNVVAQSMSGKFQERAAGGQASFVAVAEEYREALTQARDAVRAAMRDYAQDEDERAEVIKSAVR